MSSSCWLNCGSSKPTDPCWQNTGLNSLKKINRKWEIEFCEEGVLVSIDERGNIGYQIRRKKLRSSARVQIQHGQQHHHRLLCWLLHPLWRQGEVEDMELGHREGSRMDVEEPLERRTVSWMWHGAQEKHCGDQDLWGIRHRKPSKAFLVILLHEKCLYEILTFLKWFLLIFSQHPPPNPTSMQKETFSSISQCMLAK